MNKIGSEFLKEFDDYEPPFWWRFTLRQTVLLVGVLLVGGLSTVVVLYGLPEFFIYLLGGIILPPFIIYGIKKEKAIFDKLRFWLKIQERFYQTQYHERNYQKYDFSPKNKKYHESDSF